MSFAAPFVSSRDGVEKDWIDYNGHLNMAYYNVLFDRCRRRGLRAARLRRRLRQEAALSIFTAEVHVCYVRELHVGDPVRVTFQLLDYDAKRHALLPAALPRRQGWLSATSENLSLHVDMTAKKVAPFPPR